MGVDSGPYETVKSAWKWQAEKWYWNLVPRPISTLCSPAGASKFIPLLEDRDGENHGDDFSRNIFLRKHHSVNNLQIFMFSFCLTCLASYLLEFYIFSNQIIYIQPVLQITVHDQITHNLCFCIFHCNWNWVKAIFLVISLTNVYALLIWPSGIWLIWPSGIWLI